jgi:hypothetical protein
MILTTELGFYYSCTAVQLAEPPPPLPPPPPPPPLPLPPAQQRQFKHPHHATSPQQRLLTQQLCAHVEGATAEALPDVPSQLG